jgi:hypothetical protein
VSEQWAGSGGVRTSIKMNDQTTNNSGRPSNTVDAKGYYVITTRDPKTGQMVTHTVNTKEAQAAQKAAQAKEAEKMQGPPAPGSPEYKALTDKQNAEAAKAMDERDLSKNNGTAESGQAGTRSDSIDGKITPNEFDVKQREIDTVTAQQTKLDSTIADNQKISDTRSQDISSTNLQIQANADKAQVFRDQQTTIRDKQLQLSDDYAAGKISKSSYLQQDQALSAELQKAGNTARSLENQNVRLEKDVAIYQQQKDLADAHVQDATEQKAALQNQEIDQAKQLDTAEQAQTQTDYKPAVNNTPESNSGTGVVQTQTSDNTSAGIGLGGTYRGQGGSENGISDRDTAASTATSGTTTDVQNSTSPGFRSSSQDQVPTAVGGRDSSNADATGVTGANAGDNTAAGPATVSGDYTTTSTDGTGPGFRSGADDQVPTAIGARDSSNVDATGVTGANAGESPITGAAPDVGAGSALTGGALTSPQGALATGAGALSC